MRWFEGSITAAITAAKQRKVLFVVYVRGDDESSTQMDATWEDEEVSKQCIDSDMVAIKLNSNSEECKQFSQYYPVICVPCVSFISGEMGVPLEGTAGHMNPSDFKQKIDKVLQMARQESPAIPAASTSTQSPAASSTSTSSPSAPSPSTAPDTTDVACNPASPPTTTQGQKKELTKLEKAARLRQKMEEIHQRKEAQNAEEVKRKELERRKVSQATQQSQKERVDQEAKRVADEIRKEKQEDRLAKERVREQIARDRAEKQSRYDADRKEREKTQEASKEAAKTASQAPKRKINMDIARIQFRLPDGSTVTQQFDANSPLQEAQQFLIGNVGSVLREFTMSTTFPRRRFAATDMNSSFLDLELVPTAAIIVLPGWYSDMTASTSNSSSAKSSSSFGIITMLFAPLTFFWNFIYNFLFGRPSQSEIRGAGSQVPMQQTVSSGTEYSQSSTGARPKSSQVRRRTPGGDGSASRQEGNVHRLISSQDNDDENNTWNGNSTQQM